MTRKYEMAKRKLSTQSIDALKNTLLVVLSLIDKHVDWIKNNPEDPALAQIHLQMLNLIAILQPSFDLLLLLFPTINIQNISVYKQIYETALANGDLTQLSSQDISIKLTHNSTQDE